jgi:hypothetical protein
VAIAATHDAQIGLNDVTYLRTTVRALVPRDEAGRKEGRRPAWHDTIAERHYRQATLVGGKLLDILTYKLPRVGLPRPLSISGISPRDCASCGQRGSERDRCALCGAPLGVDNTAHITAARISGVLERIHTARLSHAAEREAAEPAPAAPPPG